MQLQCPHCHTTFQVDKNEYAALLSQVKTAEFDAELSRRVKEIERQNKAEAKTRELQALNDVNARIAEKDREQNDLKLEIERLKAQIANFEAVKRAEIDREAMLKDQEIARVKSEASAQINDLKADMASLRTDSELKVMKERESLRDDLHAKEQTITELKSQLESVKVNARNKVLELNEHHSALIKAKNEEIEHYKDMRSRLSVKMLGETLEQHCLNMFNRARSQGQFATAYFEKDNELSADNTKGDFIFRDFVDGREYISIMFEMKTEDERSVNKHRNEDFFAKLDKDRREKKCEYAVLVTTLEADNEFYNEGIVDVSYRYDKMLVVRPQLFMAVITMLSRTARRGAERLVALHQELEEARAQSIDVTNFERRRDQFVSHFRSLVGDHIKKQDAAMEALDKAIRAAEKQAEDLRKIKATFEASRTKLQRANDAAENDFTIRKLTWGNKTMQALFAQAREEEE